MQLKDILSYSKIAIPQITKAEWRAPMICLRDIQENWICTIFLGFGEIRFEYNSKVNITEKQKDAMRRFFAGSYNNNFPIVGISDKSSIRVFENFETLVEFTGQQNYLFFQYQTIFDWYDENSNQSFKFYRTIKS